MRSIGNYIALCTIEIDLSQVPLSNHPILSRDGIFYRRYVDVVLVFGLTELEAMVAWKENVGPLLALLPPFLLTKCLLGC